MMNKHNTVSVTPHKAAGAGSVVPKRGHFTSAFNRVAGRALSKAIGVAEVFTGWGILGVGTLGAVGIMAVSLPVGIVALPTAILLGSILAGKGMNRIYGNTGSRRARTGGPMVVPSKSLGGGGRGSRFVPAPAEEAPEKQEWYDKPSSPSPQQDPNKQWQSGDPIDPSRPNGTPWRHPGMPGGMS